MNVIQSRIDTSSDLYKQNFAAMEALVDDLKKEMTRALEERSQKARDRLKESGKIPAARKLELLLDRNSPFLEISPLAAKGLYDGKVHKAGLISGIGVVEGREVFISINDATIKGGAGYPMSAKKGLRCQTICMENRLPVILGEIKPFQPDRFNVDTVGFARPHGCALRNSMHDLIDLHLSGFSGEEIGEFM